MTSSPPQFQLDHDRTTPAPRADVPAETGTRPGLLLAAGVLGVIGVLVTLGLVLAQGGGPSPSGRSTLTVAWWLLGPGAALASWWRRRADLVFWTVTAGGSAAVLLLLSQGMLSAGAWNPFVGSTLVGALASLALLARVVVGLTAAPGSRPGAAGLRLERDRPAGERPRLLGTTSGPVRDLPVAALVVAVVLWLVVVPGQDPARMGPTGLLSTVSPLVWLAYLLLVAAAVGELLVARRPVVLGLISIAFVVGVFGVQSLALADGRNPVGWLHWGFASQIAADGQGLSNYDSRYAWPGFFAAAGFLKSVAAIGDPTQLLRWTPLWFGAVGSAGTAVVAGTVFGRTPRAWLALWVFVAGNWVGQEYFSPQGSTWALAMAVLAVVCVCALGTGERLGVRAERPARPALRAVFRREFWQAAPGARSHAATVAVVLGGLALAPSHQLTPLFLAVLLLPLAVSGRAPRWAPVFLLAVVLLWWATGARTFWMNYYESMFSAVGDVSTSLTENVGDRFSGSAARRAIIAMRLASVGAIAAVALVGIWRWKRTNGAWLMLVLWAIVPFGMAALQPYGGEMLMRSLFFTLPGLAMACAAALPRTERFGEGAATGSPGTSAARSRALQRTSLGLMSVGLGVLLMSTVVIKGQNDAFYGFTDSDLAGARAAYQSTRDGQFMVTIAASSPARSSEIGVVRQRSLQGPCPLQTIDVSCVEAQDPDVVLATRSQAAFGVVTKGLPADWLSNLTAQLVASGRFRVVFDDGQGAQVLVAADSPAAEITSVGS